MQEAYRPPCSEYSFCCPTRVPPTGGGYLDLGTPPQGGCTRTSVPPPPPPPPGGGGGGTRTLVPPGGVPGPWYPPGGYPDLGTPPGGVPGPRYPPPPGGYPGLGTPPGGYPDLGTPPGGYPDLSTPPGGGPGTPPGGSGYPPRLPHGILGNVTKHYGIWVPPPVDRQTPVKTVSSRRTTYAGGNKCSFHGSPSVKDQPTSHSGEVEAKRHCVSYQSRRIRK